MQPYSTLKFDKLSQKADQQSQDTAAALDTGLRSVLAAFGHDTVLFPIESPDTVVADDEWKALTLADSRSGSFRNKLWAHHIGVLCGRQSGGLCAIHFPRQAELDVFLKNNPPLRTALITANPKGYYLWCRARDFIPPNITSSTLNLIVGGPPILVYQRRDPQRLCWVHKLGTPPAIKLRELALPPGVARAMRVAHINTHHPLVMPAPWKRNVLNPTFVAAYLADLTGVAYDPTSEQFYTRADGRSTFYCPEMVSADALAVLPELAATAREATLIVDTTPRYLRQVVAALKIIAVRPLPSEATGLQDFIDTAIEVSPGEDITTEEVLETYKAFVVSRKVPRLSDRHFLNQLPGLLSARFGVRKAHSINRGTQRRGFSGLRLREMAGVSDASDASDGGTAENSSAKC